MYNNDDISNSVLYLGAKLNYGGSTNMICPRIERLRAELWPMLPAYMCTCAWPLDSDSVRVIWGRYMELVGRDLAAKMILVIYAEAKEGGMIIHNYDRLLNERGIMRVERLDMKLFCSYNTFYIIYNGLWFIIGKGRLWTMAAEYESIVYGDGPAVLCM